MLFGDLGESGDISKSEEHLERPNRPLVIIEKDRKEDAHTLQQAFLLGSASSTSCHYALLLAEAHEKQRQQLAQIL